MTIVVVVARGIYVEDQRVEIILFVLLVGRDERVPLLFLCPMDICWLFVQSILTVLHPFNDNDGNF